MALQLGGCPKSSAIALLGHMWRSAVRTGGRDCCTGTLMPLHAALLRCFSSSCLKEVRDLSCSKTGGSDASEAPLMWWAARAGGLAGNALEGLRNCCRLDPGSAGFPALITRSLEPETAPKRLQQPACCIRGCPGHLSRTFQRSQISPATVVKSWVV